MQAGNSPSLRTALLLHKATGLVLSPLRFALPLFRLLSRLWRDPPLAPLSGVRVPGKPLLPKRSTAIALEEPD